MAGPRLVASVLSCTVGLAFWWALSEPLQLHPLLLYGVPAALLFAGGIVAGRTGPLAAPVSLLFSLLLGSLIATRLHRAFVPGALPVSRFGAMPIDAAALALPLLAAAIVGVLGGIVGERMLPTRPYWPGQRR